MQDHLRIQAIEHLKILGDARRLILLQRLMTGPATLSALGRELGEHPAQIRHHLLQLEQAGLVELVETRVVRGFVEKYYQAKARAFSYEGMILPAPTEREPIVALGSHDLGLELLAERLEHTTQGSRRLVTLSVGSLDGLVALRQGTAHIAGCHLLDGESGEYNLPYIRHFFPDRPVLVVTLARREQGLMVAPGNPLGITGLADLRRPGITFVNRNRGSGTRIWLDQALKREGIAPSEVSGYEEEERTHTGVAEAVQDGRAAAGLGLLAAARAHGLGFLTLFHERYDLAIPQEHYENKSLRPLLDTLQSAVFRQALEALGGYDATQSSQVVGKSM